MQGRPEVSVIIPARNEQKYITTLLASLQKQSFKNFEIIVADGNSSDRTREISRAFPRVRVILERRKGIAVGRNSGAHAARGDILVFLDADTKASENLIETYLKAFQKENIVAATGPILPLEKTSREIDLGYRLVSIFLVKLSILSGKPSIVGVNFAVSRKAFQRVKGFNEHFITYEDYDLSLKLRKLGRIKFLDEAVVYASVRRVKAWGILGYFLYHTGNTLRYIVFKKPNTQYDMIR